MMQPSLHRLEIGLVSFHSRMNVGDEPVLGDRDG